MPNVNVYSTLRYGAEAWAINKQLRSWLNRGPGDVDIEKNMSYFMEAKIIKYRGSRKTGNEKRVDERNKKEASEIFQSR